MLPSHRSLLASVVVFAGFLCGGNVANAAEIWMTYINWNNPYKTSIAIEGAWSLAPGEGGPNAWIYNYGSNGVYFSEYSSSSFGSTYEGGMLASEAAIYCDCYLELDYLGSSGWEYVYTTYQLWK